MTATAMRGPYLLALDQGTTSTRAIIFDRAARLVGSAQRELQQFYPHDGMVEHDPEHIWADTVAVIRKAIQRAGLEAADITAIGITNQRETTLVWDRRTGEPVHKAIVWQDRRTAAFCRQLQRSGLEPLVQERTGLLIDPYFCATKLVWILDHVEGTRARAERGELAFGTVDSFLLWRFTSGRVHKTDATNASRTMLFDIERQCWDDDLLEAFNIPPSLLPEVVDCAGEFGLTQRELFGSAIAIAGVAGDQQAATFGQACFEPGMLKSTYGTGCFALLNTGDKAVRSTNRLLTTVAYRLDGRPTFAIEGSIFVAGAALQWLRDELRMIWTAAESEAIAGSLPDSGGVYMVPAFTGLGAPYWDPDARGAIFGLTRDTNGRHLVRAALDAVAYQTADLTAAFAEDLRHAGLERQRADAPLVIRVDGGMVANNRLCQSLADYCACTIERPAVTETTALGAAFLAGLATGVYETKADIAAIWQRGAQFNPELDTDLRVAHLKGWHDAVSRVRSNSAEGL
ncbi:glycerol kinase [Arboricoccus pini]|uniref:Glycerol kinase n=1 Tax=Arboricoccus pini TaxID=1963835 RepID=A0A212R530_9PROT|nr:glycerol kinase GlpK [Arboricoccus pini]SNB67147.1 glycerol kinase [Arboricoccus pini]